MKKFTVTILFTISILISGLQAQNNNEPLVIIGKDTISTEDFIRAYSKNNNIATATEQDLREYLDLFINFKMKVHEGEELQLDTARKFKIELMSYQKQSSSQFLVDKEVTDELMQEAYDRYKWHVRASHILVNCSEMAADKDTAAAYQKCLNIRNELLSGAITFADAAVKYSDDPSARDVVNPQTGRLHPGNKGDLGYFTLFDLIYPFESAAYNTPVGSISMPVRTRFGYHLIYVVDRIPSIEEIKIAQIFINDSLAKDNQQSPQVQKKLQEAMKQLQSGVAFEDVVKNYSEDQNATDNGGVQEPFAPNRRQGDFVKAILSLKENEFSQPIASQNGWHIVKLLEIKPTVLNEDAKYNIKNRIGRDSRSHKSKESFINKLKKEYNYDESARATGIKFLRKNMPDEFFQSKTYLLANCKGIEKLKPMATFADQELTAKDFAKYVDHFKGVQVNPEEFQAFLNERFETYVQEKIMRYEQEHLMEKHPGLRDLVQEFHDGMLLYEINTMKVWAQAVQDSTGLEQFYQQNKSKYMDQATGQPKALNDIRAVVITDYQEYLDQQWIIELRKKYNPVIKEAAFSKLLKK